MEVQLQIIEVQETN